MTEPEPAPENDDSARELSDAYDQGDFARLRTRASALQADVTQTEVARKRAREWQERVSVDVVTYALLAFALTLFCAIVWRYAL